MDPTGQVYFDEQHRIPSTDARRLAHAVRADEHARRVADLERLLERQDDGRDKKRARMLRDSEHGGTIDEPMRAADPALRGDRRAA